MSNEHKELTDYSWVKELPDWSNLKPNDVLKIFGYATVNSLSSAVFRGLFPKPDLEMKIQNKKGRPRIFWTVKTIKQEIKRRENLKKCI